MNCQSSQCLEVQVVQYSKSIFDNQIYMTMTLFYLKKKSKEVLTKQTKKYANHKLAYHQI